MTNEVPDLKLIVDTLITKGRLINNRLIEGSSYIQFSGRENIEMVCYATENTRFVVKRVLYGLETGIYRIFAFSQPTFVEDKMILPHQGISFLVDEEGISGLSYIFGTEYIHGSRKYVQNHELVNLELSELEMKNKINRMLNREEISKETIRENRERYLPIVSGLIDELKSAASSNFIPFDEEPKEFFGNVSDWFSQLAGQGKRYAHFFKNDRWAEVYSIGRTQFIQLDFAAMIKTLNMFILQQEMNIR